MVFTGVKLAVKHPWYKGKIEMKLAKRVEGNPSQANEINSQLTLERCHSKCDLCLTAVEKNGPNKNELSNNVIEEEFMHLVGIITPCVSKLSPSGLSPTCHLGDGSMHLAIVSRISRCQNLKFIKRVMSNRADHVIRHFFVSLKNIYEPNLGSSLLALTVFR